MRNRILVSLIGLLSLLGGISMAGLFGTAFTYQGKLADGGTAASGSYDFRFTLYDVPGGGTVVGGPLTNSATGVTNGYFAVTLDFGAVFDGNARWLEIGMRTNGGGAFATLAPRQPLTPAPYALYAPSAGAAATATTAASANSVAAANVTGTLALGQMPGAVVTNNAAGVTLAGTFTGSGAGLTNVNADQVDGQHGAFYQNAANLTSGTLADARLSANIPLLNANQLFTGNNLFSQRVGIGSTNTGQLLQVGDANASGSQGMIRLGSRAPTNTYYRTWDIGVPQTGGDTSGIGYSFVIDDTLLGTDPEFIIRYGTGRVGIGRTNPATALDVNGTVTATGFAGNASSLTNLNASQLTSGAVPLALLPAAVVTNNETGLNLSGTFSGNGAGLTNLNASQLASGAVADARLSANVALLNTNQVFSGSNRFAGVMLLTNAANVFVGGFTGNGAGLTNLNGTAIASGTISLAQLPTALVTNNASGVALTGTFTGNGAGVTNVDADQLDGQHGAFYQSAANLTSGTLADARLSASVALRSTTNTFTATNVFTKSVGIGAANPAQLLQIGDANTSGSQGIIRLASRSTNSAENRIWDIGVPQTGSDLSGAGYSFVIDDTQLGTDSGVRRSLGQRPRGHWANQPGDRPGCQWNGDGYGLWRQRRGADERAGRHGLAGRGRHECGRAAQRLLLGQQRGPGHDHTARLSERRRCRPRFGQRRGRLENRPECGADHPGRKSAG